jgi:hypothetical protein
MLADTLTLGASPDNLDYVRQYGDAGKSNFGVRNTAVNAARIFRISHTVGKSNGRRRSVAQLVDTDVDPSSVVGKTEDSLLHIVLDASVFKTVADKEKMRKRILTFVSTPAMWDAFASGEV